MKTNYARKVSQQAFNQLVEAVEAGKSNNIVEYFKVISRFQRPDATQVAGFHTWRKLGRFVKKNEKGIAIMAPIIWRKKTEEKEEDETVLAFKTAYVFDISQTDGKQLPEFARVHGEPGIYVERLRKYITGRGIRLEYSNAIRSAEGLSAGGLIVLKKGLSAAEELSVLSHELAHENLHSDRDKMPKDRKIRETEAEAVAFVVCHGIGLDTNTASSDYIQLYNGDKKTLMQSLERIQRTASDILDAIMSSDKQDAVEELCLTVAA